MVFCASVLCLCRERLWRSFLRKRLRVGWHRRVVCVWCGRAGAVVILMSLELDRWVDGCFVCHISTKCSDVRNVKQIILVTIYKVRNLIA